ncbi:hypothetical protein Pla100_29460 [Neorhodopirellula pilleata]|uniref:Uncharacterized protein n=1 Tax=Neorhodopirellula pilleata TaxID=2714738 RepID=A0A5C6AAJ7_9BACT|nr:hypothetical protein Pla100_29460 [Neorhodopirellula pilleata]
MNSPASLALIKISIVGSCKSKRKEPFGHHFGIGIVFRNPLRNGLLI